MINRPNSAVSWLILLIRKKRKKSFDISHQRLVNAELLGKTGYWNWEVKNNKVTWSEGTYRVFGETPGNFKETYEDFLKRINTSDTERVKRIIQEVYEKKKSASYEFWIKTPDNEDKYIATTAEVVLDKNRKCFIHIWKYNRPH